MVKAVLGSGALNTKTNEFYATVEAAIAEATAGDTINVFGPTNAGFVVNKKDLTITGDVGSKVTSAISILGVDGVTISGLTITPSNVGGPQVAGIYLDDAEGVTIRATTSAAAPPTAPA